jgi:hypothetical protein
VNEVLEVGINMMKASRIFALSIILYTAASSVHAQARQRTSPPTATDLIGAAHQNGYEEGYLAGYERGSGGELLKECNFALSFADRRAKTARRYEDCISQLKVAVMLDDATLRQTARQCVSIMQ